MTEPKTSKGKAQDALLSALETSRQRQAEIQALLQATRAILESPDFSCISRAIFDACKELIGATSGYVALLSPDGQENQVLFLDAGGRECTVDPNLPMPIRGLRAEAYRTAQVVYDNDFANQPRWTKFMPAGHMTLDNVLFAPLVIGGETLGLLGLANKEGGFTPDDARLVAGFGELGAIALANHRINEERDRLIQALKTEQTRLEEANQELEAFSYSVSHDLRGPLRAIDGFSRVLLEEQGEQLDPEGHRLLRVIRINTRIMDELIEDLLALARLGRKKLRKGPVNLAHLARGVFSELQAACPDRECRLKVAQNLPMAFGDSALLKQVLVNLLSNALKFTRSRKPATIEVGGQTAGAENIYSVRDNGVGFDNKYKDKLFGVFQRLHRGQEFEGSGVGLAIVQRIMQRHGGRVWAEGKMGEGAAFYFALPRKESAVGKT